VRATGVTCHMSVTCRPTQVNTPFLNPSRTGRYAGLLHRSSVKCVVVYIGRCKGYGFVEFAHNHEKSELARRQVDGMAVSGSVLQCQFVPSSLVRFTDLHSRSLLVTNIPRDASTTATLCALLSIISKPLFYQVVK